MKRKGYKTIEQQIEANKRYLENNPEAKEKAKISNYRSKARKFILELATKKDLEELKDLIKQKIEGLE
ncbi:hypothetical protein [Fusobacterium sp. SYSU M8A802]